MNHSKRTDTDFEILKILDLPAEAQAPFTCSASTGQLEFFDFKRLHPIEQRGYELEFEIWDVVDDIGYRVLRCKLEYPGELSAWGWSKRCKITDMSAGEQARLEAARGEPETAPSQVE